MTARRLLWGKVLNAGQTCLAPDYVLVPRSFQDTLVEALTAAHASFYPDHAKPSSPGTYSRIITPQAFNRIKTLLDNTTGDIVIGGEMDEETKYIAPTVVKDVSGGDSLMREELFGPVLPIVPVEDIDAAIAFVNAREHPLALYVFTRDPAVKAKVFEQTQSGSVMANEVVLQPSVDGLPFGGVGPSGHGAYTGKYGFEMFTHQRASLDSPNWVDKILGFRFPPYTNKGLKMAGKLYPSLPARPKGPPTGKENGGWGKWLLFGLALALAGGLARRGRLLK